MATLVIKINSVNCLAMCELSGYVCNMIRFSQILGKMVTLATEAEAWLSLSYLLIYSIFLLCYLVRNDTLKNNVKNISLLLGSF